MTAVTPTSFAGRGRIHQLFVPPRVVAANKVFGDVAVNYRIDRAAFGEEGLNKLLKERTRRQLRDYSAKIRSAGSGLLERVRALSEIRSAQGYMSECMARPDGTILFAENHCPICIAAESCQGLCREELSLFREVLGKKTTVERTDHILAGARRCAYVICPARSTAFNHSGIKTPGQD